MLYRILRALPFLLAALAPTACVIDLGDLDDLGVCGDHHDLRREQLTFDEPVTAVIVDGGMGDVRVRAHDGAGAVVDASWSDDDDRPQMRVHDGVLHVSPACGAGCCYAELSLAIPAAATLEVDLGTGEVEVADLSGVVELDVGTGDVSLTWDGAASLAALAIDVGTGSVDLRVPEGAYDLRISAGVGDVSVADLQDRDDASGRIDVDVGTGDIRVRGL